MADHQALDGGAVDLLAALADVDDISKPKRDRDPVVRRVVETNRLIGQRQPRGDRGHVGDTATTTSRVSHPNRGVSKRGLSTVCWLLN